MSFLYLYELVVLISDHTPFKRPRDKGRTVKEEVLRVSVFHRLILPSLDRFTDRIEKFEKPSL